jgi:hypothetical protein
LAARNPNDVPIDSTLAVKSVRFRASQVFRDNGKLKNYVLADAWRVEQINLRLAEVRMLCSIQQHRTGRMNQRIKWPRQIAGCG